MKKKKKRNPWRPSKYNAEMQTKTENFYNRFLKLKKKNIPFIEQLAIELEVDPDTIKNWAEKNDLFGSYIGRILSLQKFRLQERSVYKNAPVFGEIFLLKANHKMIEAEKLILAGSEKDDAIKIKATVEMADDSKDLTDDEISELRNQG